LRTDFIPPVCTGNSLTGVGTTCLLMDFNGNLEEVVSMCGDIVFRLVEDGGCFVIDRSSKGDSIDCGFAVENKAAVMVVLSSWSCYCLDDRCRGDDPFSWQITPPGCICVKWHNKSETVWAVEIVASQHAIFLKVGMEIGRYSTTQNIVRCVIEVSFADRSTELPHIRYFVRIGDVSRVELSSYRRIVDVYTDARAFCKCVTF
jgi:hypothetical protein